MLTFFKQHEQLDGDAITAKAENRGASKPQLALSVNTNITTSSISTRRLNLSVFLVVEFVSFITNFLYYRVDKLKRYQLLRICV